MSKQSFIILTPGFPKDESDSTCLPMQQAFVQTLKGHYPELEIIILSFQYPYFAKKYFWNSLQVRSFDGRNRGGIFKLITRFKIYKELNKIHKQTTIKGLFSFWYGECALVGERFALNNDLKHFCWLLGQDARKGNKYVHKIFPNANNLIALSDFLQEEFEQNHKIKPRFVIPPGVVQSDFNSTPEHREIDILAVGSLISLKRYDWLTEIAAQIKLINSNIKVVLVGKGPEKDKLQSLIKHYQLENNFTLTGELPYPEVLSLMQKSKILLHPSSYEGFSGVCLEALAAGVHVISICKPMNTQIQNWTIVTSKEEMIKQTNFLLQKSLLKNEPVTPYKMEDTVQRIAELFGL